jgi:signal transduction histidine kinase
MSRVDLVCAKALMNNMFFYARRGEGDLHDTTYTKYGQSTMLAGPGLFSATSSAYKLTFYPNDDFFQVYYTNNSTLVVIGAVAILLVTSIMFAIFGHFVRKPFQSKQALFDGKRRFVRFVSHEVRTPLNSICMGLRILLDEMERCATEAAHNRDQGLPVDIDKLSTTLDEWKDDGREVLRNAHNAAGILTDLLAFDKVESGTLKLELSVVKIWPMLQDVVADYQLAAQRKRRKCIACSPVGMRMYRATFHLTCNPCPSVSLNLDMSALCPSSTEETAEEGGLVVWPELPLATQQIRIVGDRTKLLQVVRNLISSAIKFTPEDGRITVRPRLEENGQKGRPLTSTFTLEGGRVATFPVVGLLHLDVEDTGTGMTPEQIGQLFGEGGQFNVNVLHAGQGSGLGLYIAKGIAVQHGGALKATSDGLGKGSKFTLTLPVYRQADGASSPHNDLDFSEFSIHTACTADALPSLPTPTLSSAHDGATAAIGAPAVVATSGTEMSVTEAAPPLSSSPSPSPPPRPQSLRILVVDDAKTNRKLLSRMLQRHGHVCDEAEDGLIAVDKVRESLEAGQRYDSILCDYEMPNMNVGGAVQKRRGCIACIV